MTVSIKNCKKWYDNSYRIDGFNAQRKYPNEELIRFLGRNFFKISLEHRKKIKVLEIGCGSCANLWAIANEGFNSYGLDFSETALKIGNDVLKNWNTNANLSVGSMTDIQFKDNSFDMVIDVFSSYCLTENEYIKCLKEVYRILKKGGRLFSYTPCKTSSAFINHEPSKLLDSSTLNGIQRVTSPFYGNNYSFRFILPQELKDKIEQIGMKLNYLETVKKTYYNQMENFDFVVFEAEKK